MWSEADLRWLSANYPSLRVIREGVLGGRLTFQMLRTYGKYYVNPNQELFEGKRSKDFLYISDTYDIEIRPVGEYNQIMAYEVGGKIDQVGRRLGKTKIDMHKYNEGGLCVASSMEIDRAYEHGFDLSHFIENFLIPYLFAQTNYANTEKWLWGDLAHGFLGLLQWLGRLDNWYDEDIELTYKWLNYHKDKDTALRAIDLRWRSHKKCICGSGKKNRDCHPEVKKALSLIRIAINNGTLDTTKYENEE